MWITLVNQSLMVYQDPNAQPMQKFLLVDAMIRHSVDVPDQRGHSSSTLFSSQDKEEFTIVVEMGGAGNERGGGVSDGDDWISISLPNKDGKVSNYSVCCKSVLTFLSLSLSHTHTYTHTHTHIGLMVLSLSVSFMW